MQTIDGMTVKAGDTVYVAMGCKLSEVKVNPWMIEAVLFCYGSKQAAAEAVLKELDKRIRELSEERERIAAIAEFKNS